MSIGRVRPVPEKYPAGYRRCIDCSELKRTEEFPKSAQTKSKLFPICKRCAVIRTKARTERLRAAGLCSSCGQTVPIDGGFGCARCMEKARVRAKAHSRKEPREKKAARARAAYHRNKTNPLYRLRRTLRNRFLAALSGGAKKGSAVSSLGCSIQELKKYLEERFEPGMSWSNHGIGAGKWNIDHIVPFLYVDLSDEADLKRVLHYTNLRPLWHEDNQRRNRKGAVLAELATLGLLKDAAQNVDCPKRALPSTEKETVDG